MWCWPVRCGVLLPPDWLLLLLPVHPRTCSLSLPPSLQTGATTGYSLLWVLLWSTAMGYLLQSLAARL